MSEDELSDPLFVLDADSVFRARSLSEFPWLEHGFGARASGGWPNAPLLLKQVHSDRVLEAGRISPGEPGDALITDQPGLWLCVRTADCLPILIADSRARAVAAVHAGWRGTAGGIVTRTVAALNQRYGSRPSDLVAAIGPGIGGCCFEVGPEVARLFQNVLPERRDLDQKTRIDLAEVNRRQLLAAGVPEPAVSRSRRCTRCDAALFHSWRRDGPAAGRMITGIRVNN